MHCHTSVPRLNAKRTVDGHAIVGLNIAFRYFIDDHIAFRYCQHMKRVAYSKAAEKSLDRMQPKRRQAIRAKVDAYARGESIDIKKLVGSDLYRIRVGQDRVIIDDQGIVVMVIDAGPRGGIYKE